MSICMRKSKGIGEITVMEVAGVGVRTRAQALAMEDTRSSKPGKRRKVGPGELKSSSSLVHLRRSRHEKQTPDNSITPVTTEDAERTRGWCSIPSSDHFPASCCSSNASSDLTKERLKIVDLEDETSTCVFDNREKSHPRREATPTRELQAESGNLDSTARPGKANSPRSSTVEKMPSESEIEEFFSAAEKEIQKQFTEKYNFDVEKDLPLEGRYEWVQIKQ